MYTIVVMFTALAKIEKKVTNYFAATLFYLIELLLTERLKLKKKLIKTRLKICIFHIFIYNQVLAL